MKAFLTIVISIMINSGIAYIVFDHPSDFTKQLEWFIMCMGVSFVIYHIVDIFYETY